MRKVPTTLGDISIEMQSIAKIVQVRSFVVSKSFVIASDAKQMNLYKFKKLVKFANF